MHFITCYRRQTQFIAVVVHVGRIRCPVLPNWTKRSWSYGTPQTHRMQWRHDRSHHAQFLWHHRYFVGIAGGPGSGKSTLSREVCEAVRRLHGSSVAVAVPMDGEQLPSTWSS